MAQTIAIPGRRVQDGETFFTDWSSRGGDCVILRVQVLVAAGGSIDDKVEFALETRGENGTAVETMDPTSSAISADSTGIHTCLYLAGTADEPGNGAQEQVRVKVSVVGGSGGYFVVRIFPLIFFDSAKVYT